MAHYSIPDAIKTLYNKGDEKGRATARAAHVVWMLTQGLKEGDTYELLEIPKGFGCPVGQVIKDFPALGVEEAVAKANSPDFSDNKHTGSEPNLEWPDAESKET